LERSNIREDLARLAKLASEKNVALILMGNPLHMSGREGRQTEYTRDFAERLHAATGLPVEFRDERLTTVEAERVLRQSGISIQKRAKAVDRLAAVILLESYLDSRRL
jgi:putative Holliday junction resolvase